MGRGIMGGIPISFRFGSIWRYSKYGEQDAKEKFMKHTPEGMFDFYTEESEEIDTGKQIETATYYNIKPEILLPNFKDFFYEFHKLIGNDLNIDYKKFNDKYDAVVAANDLAGFVELLDDNAGYAPAIFSYFESSYIAVRTNLLVYHGSYKAILDGWSTLLHMERLIRATMSNPLAKVMRMGMST
jgi:hypothetical protein